MSIEIERKFLVDADRFKKPGRRQYIRQGYISTSVHHIVRVRLTGRRAILAIKSQVSATERCEYEYEIPYAEGEEILDRICQQPLIEKNRYIVRVSGNRWEVDEFLGENEGLTVAEIELRDPQQQFIKPDWVGREVTHDQRYLNANLVRHPYRHWKK